MSLARYVRCSALVLVLFGAACSDDAPESTGDDLPARVSVQVGAKGGTLKASGGLTLEIPEGALEKNVKITATNAGLTAPKEIQAKQVSDLYEFGPEGTKFKKDVKVVFHTAKEEQNAVVYFTTEDGSGFEKIKSEKNGTEITAFVKHFSQGFVGVPLDDEIDEPSDAGGDEPDADEGELDASVDVAPEQDAGQDAAQEPSAEMDAGTSVDAADPSTDTGAAIPAKDAGVTQPTDAAVAEAAVDAAPPTAHIVVRSRDMYGVLVNQTWAAFQDGKGAWQPLAVTSKTGIYEFDVASTSFGVAFVCSTSDMADSWGSVAFEPSSTLVVDVTAHGTPCTQGAVPAPVNLQGTLTLNPDVYWRLGHAQLTSYGNYSGAPANFSTTLQQNIVNDLLFATSVDFQSVNRVVVRRDVSISAATTNYNVNMDAGVAPQGSAQAQVLNGSATTSLDVRYTTRNTEDGLWLNSTATTGSSTRAASFATLPEGIRRTADRYLLLGAEASSNNWRRASLSSYPSANMSVALPPQFVTAFSSLTTPYLRPSFSFTPVSGASGYAMSIFYSPVRTSSHSFDIAVNPAWLSGSGTQTLTFPDFSQVAGFQSAWVAPSAGAVSLQSVVRVAKSDAAGDLKSESGQSSTIPPP